MKSREGYGAGQLCATDETAEKENHMPENEEVNEDLESTAVESDISEDVADDETDDDFDAGEDDED